MCGQSSLKLPLHSVDKVFVKSPKDRAKILIASPEVESLIQSLGQSFKLKHELQTATSSKMALFLLREWEPHLCLIDSQLDFAPLLLKIRELRGLSVGLLVYCPLPKETQGSKVQGQQPPPWQKKEEQAFLSGADHFIPLKPEFGKPDCLDGQPLVWRVDSLWRRFKRAQEEGNTQLKVVTASSSQLIESPTSTESPKGSPPLRIGELEILPEDYLVRRQGERVSLTPTQFRLLLSFVGHPETLLSRQWLKENVWENSEISLRSIDAQISKLRKLVPEIDLCLINIYGKGYVFNLPAKGRAA